MHSDIFARREDVEREAYVHDPEKLRGDLERNLSQLISECLGPLNKAHRTLKQYNDAGPGVQDVVRRLKDHADTLTPDAPLPRSLQRR